MMRKNGGFSLLEVLVAVTIIGFGFSVLFAGMSASHRGLERVESIERRVELARLKLAELDLIKRIPPRDSAAGEFDDGTRWKLESFPFIAPIEVGLRRNVASVIRIDLTLEWMGRNGIQKRVIQTYRYLPGDATPPPSLEEQLRELR
ncbi:MAG: type II secretion system protein [Acidobacteria bacterium]|nr:type II secretion system protein [Acidobacteriota bacterium]